ncbi:PH domain-containing protein [Paenibacillus graminis]|uniref:PH domain-containing protein n=1 Tax=Paenibacillus graminis TaxID=189425 RepID=UPI002DBA8D25|nr:PH domain-containing protein [Paenibacillus graminis]MEC0169876.1 PH domain-containing protein [Paenibacillus graminis]
MTETAREPSLSGLLNQFEVIGGPEEFGPEGLAIAIALWRKSSKLNWMQTFQMTNTELMVQTGIATRKTLNVYRSKLVEAGIIAYEQPPRGSSKGTYSINFELINSPKAVTSGYKSEVIEQELGQEAVTVGNHFGNNFSEVEPPVVTSGYHSSKVVTVGNHFGNTVLKDTTITTTPTTDDSEFSDEISADPVMDGMIAILNAYCKMNRKLDFHVRPKEREAMGRMVAGGMPVPFTISTMESLLQAKREREGDGFEFPTSFFYYDKAIHEAWRNFQTTSPPMAGDALGNVPDKPERKTKQQRELEELDRMIEEEQKRGQGRGRDISSYY